VEIVVNGDTGFRVKSKAVGLLFSPSSWNDPSVQRRLTLTRRSTVTAGELAS